MAVPLPATPGPRTSANGFEEDDDVFDSDTATTSDSHGFQHRFSTRPDLGPLDLSSTSSPSQLKRTIEAHLQETDRRLQDTQQLGTSLLKQREELSSKLEEVEQFQDEAQIPNDLRRRLVDIEKEHADVSREVARALIAPKPKQDDSQEAGVFTSQATASPTKISAPSRRHRNQPSTRAGDLQFAADISTSLLAQVRQLQATVAEKDDFLKRSQAEKEAIEHDLLALSQKNRALNESEQKYKDENWNLETQKHELLNNVRDAQDKEKKLNASLGAAVAERTKVQNTLDELRMYHSKLSEEHSAVRKAHDTEIHGLKRNADMADTERQSLQDRIDELVSQNQELAKAFSSRSRSRQISPGEEFISTQEESREALDTPDESPPPSPTKATPRHGGLESETLKSSLHHAHRMIQNLKGNIHREKTEKIELRRMLQDARDELESRRGDTGSGAKRQKTKAETFKKPLRPDMLGGNRRPRTDVELTDDDWEDHNLDSPSYNRPVNTFQTTRPPPQPVTDLSDAYQTAEETENNFDTADERNTTESEAFMTGAESLAGDSTDELTETEDTASRTGRPAPGRVGRSIKSVSAASTSADEGHLQTPMQPSFTKFKLRSRASYNKQLVASQEGTPESFRSQSIAQDSPATVIQSPGVGEQSLFAELGGMDEFGSETNSTPARSSTMSSTQSTPGFAYTPSKSVNILSASTSRPPMVDSATMTEPLDLQAQKAGPDKALLPSAIPLPRDDSEPLPSRTDTSTQYTPQRALAESPVRPTSSHITPPKTMWDEAHEPNTPLQSATGRPLIGYSDVLSQDSQPVQSPTYDLAATQRQLEKLQADLAVREEELQRMQESHAAALLSAAGELDALRDEQTKRTLESQAEYDTVRQTHADALQRLQDQIEQLGKTHATSIADKESELETLRASQAAALAIAAAELARVQESHASDIVKKDSELQTIQAGHEKALSENKIATDALHHEHSIALDELRAEIASLKDGHSSELASKEAQFAATQQEHDKSLQSNAIATKQMRDAHDKVMAAKDGEMQELRTQHETVLAAKDADIVALHDNHSKSIEAKSDELSTMRATHLASLAALRAEMEQLQKNHDAEKGVLGQTISNHKTDLATKQKDLDDMHTRFTAASSESDVKLAALAASHSETNAKHSTRITELGEELSQKRSEVDSLRATHAEELDRLRVQISGHSEELGSRQTELEQLQAVHDTELGSLRRQLSSLQEDLEKRTTDYERMQKERDVELNDLRIQLALHSENLGNKQTELDGLKGDHSAEVERLRGEINTYLLTTQNKEAELQEQALSHAKYKESTELQLSSHRDDLVSRETELSKLRSEHEGAVTSLNTALASIRAELESSQKAHEGLQQTHQDQLHSLNAELASVKLQVDDKQRDLDQAKLSSARDIEALNANVASHKQQLSHQEEEFEHAKSLSGLEIASLQAELSSHKQHLGNTQQELEVVQKSSAQELEVFRKQLAEKQSEADQAHSVNAQELERLRAQIEDSDTVVKNIQNAHHEELTRLRAELSAQQAELQRLHSALAVAHASRTSGFSSILSQDTQPGVSSTDRSASPERPRTAEKIIGGSLIASAAGASGYAIGQSQTANIVEDSTAGVTRDGSGNGKATLAPLTDISGNAVLRPRRYDDVFGGPLEKGNSGHDQGSQTTLTSDQIDLALRSKRTSITPVPASSRNRSPGSRTPVSPTRYPGQHSSRSRDVAPIFEDESAVPPRPGSASSQRTSSMLSQSHPPLPSDHKDIIAKANSQVGSPTRQTSSVRQGGVMGPPMMPASAMRRPRTPNESIRSSSRIGQNGKRGTVSSQISRRSSVSSFASELDERFNIRTDQQAGFEAGPGTDPRMIQAITQTMIGEFLWKYTRKTGSKEMSNTRHRRYFWVHPYTKTLYWSDQDPQTAGRTELKAKSVPIESVRVVSDDNPMPPGLHRKSLEVTTPGRKVRFTASTGQRHETWFNALSYLLHRGEDNGDTGVSAADNGEITREDIAEFSVNGYGARLVPNDSRMSMSSYNSRTTSGTTRRVGRQSMPIGSSLTSNTTQGGVSTDASTQLNDATVRDRLEVPQAADKNRTIRASSVTRISKMFGSVTNKNRSEHPETPGESSSQRGNSSIYDASVVSDDRREEEEEDRRKREQEQRPGLEDVRACCDGKHHVGSLTHRHVSNSSTQNRISSVINRSMSRRT